ncbi:MAG: DUF4268 domain-containing protein [Bacteroidota bacterium]
MNWSFNVSSCSPDSFYFASMYTKQEASLIKKRFWTNFGQYMKPVTGADGSKINWLNYKTGIRHIYFRMDADNKSASIAIEFRHPDTAMQLHYFEQLRPMKTLLEKMMGEEWDWHVQQTDEDGNTVSRISKTVDEVNIFNETDWPVIISFFKPRIMTLDEFWIGAKDMLGD